VRRATWPLAYAGLLLQGEPDTTVEPDRGRMRRPEPQTVKLTRAKPDAPPWRARCWPARWAHQRRCASPAQVKETAAAIEKLQKGGRAETLVLDLRSCAWARG